MKIHQYTIKNYQEGFETDQVKIGQEVAQHWVWPYAYDLEDLLEIHTRPDFDPDTRHYCFLGDEMVGYMFSNIQLQNDSRATAILDFPRMRVGHEQAAKLLIESALDTLTIKGVSYVTGMVTTMHARNVQLAEDVGFSIQDWGFKVYYSYQMSWGKLTPSSSSTKEINIQEELDDCSRLASHWYKQPSEWCKSYLKEWHQHGIITHSGVWQHGELIASCMAAPNLIQPSTAANYYIYTPDAFSLKSLLSRVVNTCIDRGVHNLIADLVNEHRTFEPVYQELGFEKVAEWARCEMDLK